MGPIVRGRVVRHAGAQLAMVQLEEGGLLPLHVTQVSGRACPPWLAARVPALLLVLLLHAVAGRPHHARLAWPA